MKRFNTMGTCVGDRHYMVNMSSRVAKMRVMVERGDYLCVNRPRQYGKTTLLAALEKELCCDHVVASLNFQALSPERFAGEGTFVRALCRRILRLPCAGLIPATAVDELSILASADP